VSSVAFTEKKNMFPTAEVDRQCRCVIMAQWWVKRVGKWYREFGNCRTDIRSDCNRVGQQIEAGCGSGFNGRIDFGTPGIDNNSEVEKAVGE
jgi:hypothetical protein